MTPGQIQTLEDNRELWVLMRDHGYLPNGTQHRVQAVVNVYVALTGSIPNISCPPCLIDAFRHVYNRLDILTKK